MSDKFVVTIPVKPYVKRFVELNYGLPADFTNFPDLYKEVQIRLRKPETQYDRKLETKLCTYSETLEIVISQDLFYRHGWEFSRTDIVSFGKIFENTLKSKMHTAVTVYRGIGVSTKDSILRFQDNYRMEEEYWPFDSIKKEYSRKRPDIELDFFTEIISQIDHLLMLALSPKRDNARTKKIQNETV